MKEPTAPLIGGKALGPIVAALSGMNPRPPDWVIPTLAELAEGLAREVLPMESDATLGTYILSLSAELVAHAHADVSKWRDPPEDGWPRGAGRRRRLGAIAETLANSAALSSPGFSSLPPTLRRRSLQLARTAVVMLARHDPQVGSRLIAPERARVVLERALSVARTAHDLGRSS